MFIAKKKGIIALDIDGTITDKDHLIPDCVATFLEDLSLSWHIFLITGRSLSFAEKSITKLNFPYMLGLQNGADVLFMPEKKLLKRCYISLETLVTLENDLKGIPNDFIVYSGFERGDFCYWRPAAMSKTLIDHCELIATLAPAPWIAVDSFADIEQKAFPLLKYFGSEEEVAEFSYRFLRHKEVATSIIRDPLKEGLFLVLATDSEVDKGKTLKGLIDDLNLRGLPVIAAGDDCNDIPMLEVADLKIVVETAPASMHRHADILAKPSSEFGIIRALEQAIEKMERV